MGATRNAVSDSEGGSLLLSIGSVAQRGMRGHWIVGRLIFQLRCITEMLNTCGH